MYANEYQGGTHVEVLGTQGQNPLGQWKISGPQKGIQKVYDKALKGYVFAASGGCRLALPRDERAALGLTQPHLLLQLEVGVGVPFSLEMGLTDASGTRRRVILSSSFSELKCSPLHCQVPFSSVPREAWLNLVLPLADLAAALFRQAGAGTGSGAASGGPGTGGGGGAAALGVAALAYRSLDSLQLAGTCRLRRIATLRELPQSADAQDAAAGPAPQPKPLDFPPGVESQTLLLDPRSLTFVSLAASSGMGASGGLGNSGVASGSRSGGLGVVGTSTGSARRVAPSGGSASGGAAAAAAAAAAAQLLEISNQRPSGSGAVSGSSRDEGARSPTGNGSLQEQAAVSVAAAPHPPGEAPAHGSPARHLAPLVRGSGSAAGTPGSPHAGQSPLHPHSEHMPPSRLGRISGVGPSGGALTASPSALQLQQLTLQSQEEQAQAGQTAAGPGPASGTECASAGASGKLPRVHLHGVASADDVSAGDASPLAGRRVVSANNVVRYGQPNGAAAGAADAAAAAAGSGGAAAAAAGASGTASGAPRSPPWPRSVMGKRAQSGPARISTETLSQGLGETSAPHDMPASPSTGPRASRRYNASHLPPTISEHEAMPPTPCACGSNGGGNGSGNGGGHSGGNSGGNGGGHGGGVGTPSCRSPNRSPSRLRPSVAITTPAAATSAATPSLPMLRVAGGSGCGSGGSFSGAANGREPPSPVAGTGGGGLGAQLSSLLMVRGGVDASMDFASAQQNVLLDSGPGSPSLLSTLHRVNSMRAHRYGSVAATGVASGASGGMSSDSEDGGGGGGAGGGGGSTAAAAHDLSHVVVPRIRTRVLQGGGGGGGKGGEGGGKSPSGPHPAAGPVASAASTAARKLSGAAADADTPTRGGRTSSVAGTPGRVSPVNAPAKAGAVAGRLTPPPLSGMPSDTSPATAAGTRTGAAGSGAGAAGGSASGPSPARRPRSGGAATPSSPARQRPAAATPPRAGRPGARPANASGNNAAGGGASGLPAPPPDTRDRLPPLGRPAAGAGGQGGRGSHIPKPGPHPPAVGSNAARASRGARSASTHEVDVEESITLAAGGLWGGFGVDEEDDMLGSRHFRSAHGYSTSRGDEPDDEVDGGVEPSGPSFGGGAGGWGAGAVASSPKRSPGAAAADTVAWDLGGMHLPPVGIGGPSPPATATAGGRGRGGGGGLWPSPMSGLASALAGEEPLSPPVRYPHHANAPLSPPIRRSGNVPPESAAEGTPQRHGTHHAPAREATFSGFVPAGAAGRRSGGGGESGDGGISIHPWDPMLDEEALLAGHMGDLVSYDDWGRIDQRPTPPGLLNSQRAFTPPVVPASRSLGVGLGGGTASGGTGADGAGPQVLRVAEGRGAGGAARGQGVVAPAGGEAMLDLVYDPVLNCYYDGATGQYYELKT